VKTYFGKSISRCVIQTFLLGGLLGFFHQAVAGELIFEGDSSAQSARGAASPGAGSQRPSPSTRNPNGAPPGMNRGGVVDFSSGSVDPQNAWTIFATDGRLATTFERWAGVAGMKLLWDAQQHVMLSTSDSYFGTFKQALERVLSSPAIRQSEHPLEACIYQNNPQILRITRLGEQKDCQ
jgi:hypothetical protein